MVAISVEYRSPKALSSSTVRNPSGGKKSHIICLPQSSLKALTNNKTYDSTCSIQPANEMMSRSENDPWKDFNPCTLT